MPYMIKHFINTQYSNSKQLAPILLKRNSNIKTITSYLHYLSRIVNYL